MNDTPLIYTSMGNIPIDDTIYTHQWVETEDMMIFKEEWHHKVSGELVKNNFHAHAKRGFTIGAEQARM